MNALSDFGLKGASIALKRCATNGMTRRLSSSRSARMTGISTFFDNKHQHPMGIGIWSRFGRRARNADILARHLTHLDSSARAYQMGYSTATFVPFCA